MAVTIHKKKGRPRVKSVPLAKTGMLNTLADEGASRGQFKRIYDMPEDKKEQLDAMLASNESVPVIAKIVSQDWGLFPDLREGTVMQYLYKYKDAVIKPNAVIAAMPSEQRAIVLEKIKGTIDVLEEMGQLYAIQKSRVNKLVLLEKPSPMLFNTLGAEIKLMADVLQRYSDLAVDFGILRMVPKTTKISKGVDGSTTIESEGRQQVMINAEQDRKMDEAASLFFSIIEGEAKDVTNEE